MGANETETTSNLEESEFFENFETYKVLAIDLMSDSDWKKPIVEYLGNPTGVTD